MLTKIISGGVFCSTGENMLGQKGQQYS